MKRDAREALLAEFGAGVVFEVPMARHTSLRVGGLADAMVQPENEAEAVACLALCARYGLPVTPVGGGFNLLVRDGGLRGVVLRTARLRGLDVEGARLRAEAGVSHSQIARCCGDRGLRGLEFAAGIPGSVGGWIAMNAGVPAREMADAVEAVDIATAAGVETLDVSAMAFGYRVSEALTPTSLALRAHFLLTPGDASQIRAEVDTHLAHRRLTQPVDQPSCGSVFKNPAGEHAGQLIEAVGLKGFRIGGAAVSSVHANFIVTERGAQAAEVLGLIEHIQESVHRETGTLLEPEVRILGDAA